MIIKCLMEDTKCNEDLLCEHGLCLYIETEKNTILFDTGQTGNFVKNAMQMGVDLEKVDFVVLSHGHYDHSGGIETFLKINKTAKIYMNEFAKEPHFNGNSGTQKYIGIDLDILKSDRIVFVSDYLKVAENAEIFSCNDRKVKYPIKSYGLNMIENENYVPDDFRHEEYLLLKENGKNILISGCSHRGILNIMNWFSPDYLIGGFHFVKLDPETKDGADELLKSAEILNSYNTIYYTGHCTGVPQYEFLKKHMNENLNYISTGRIVKI